MKKLQILILILAFSSLAKADYFDDLYDYFYPPHPHKPPTKPTPPPTPPLITDPQECHDNLGDLMDGEGNTLMTNTCDTILHDGEQAYKITVSFLPPYIFNNDCLDLQVILNDKIFDDWMFDGENIMWTLKQKDLVYLHKCQFLDDGEGNIMWICNFSVDILFMNIVQQSYIAKLKVTLDRMVDGEVSVIVDQNTVDNDACCENKLNIDTELRVCTDINCDSFLSDGELVFIRKESIFLEHSITTPAFQDYYLTLNSITLNNFFPSIQNLIVEQGRLIIEIQSFIAKPDLTLTVISKLHKTDPSRLRFLQDSSSNNNNDNYKLKGVTEISIVRDDENNSILNSQDQKKVQQWFEVQKTETVGQKRIHKDLFVGAVAAISLLTLMILFSIIYCVVQKVKANRKKKYELSDIQTTSNEQN